MTREQPCNLASVCIDDGEVRQFAVTDRRVRLTDPLDRSLACERMGIHARPGRPPLAVDLELRFVGVVADELELLEPGLEPELAERGSDGIRRTRRSVAACGPRADIGCERLDQVHPSDSSAAGPVPYDHAVRPRPKRLQRLPQQYFVTLLGRVAAAAAKEG